MTQNNRIPLLIYIILPCTISLTLMAMYYSGIPWLQNIIVPTMPSLHTNSWREFGLLENIEHAYILVTFFFCVKAVSLKPYPLEKMAAIAAAAFTLLIFLEEIDYGLHYYEWIFQIPPEERLETRNLHNTSEAVLQNIRRAVDVSMALLFLIAPITLNKVKHPLAQYITPNRWLLGTAVCTIILSEITHILDDLYLLSHTIEEHKLYKNASEFREVTVYYIFMLYIWELVYKRSYHRDTQAQNT